MTGLAFLLALLYLSPVLLMLVASFKPDALVLTQLSSWRALWPEQASLQNYADVFRRVQFGHFLGNSLLLAGAITGLGLLINSLAGYSLARTEWRGRQAALSFNLALLILPFEALAVPLFYLVTLAGGRDTYLAQILPFLGNAFSIYLFYSFFRSFPAELEQAARVDGANPWQIFRHVVVPNSRPVFATVAMLTFLGAWGQYLWPTLITSGEKVRPLPLAMANFYTLPPLQWGDICAFGVLMALPVMALFALLQRWIAQALAQGGSKG